MKSLLFSACLLLCCIYSYAQVADSTIFVTLNTDAKYTGKVIEEAKGRYIRLQEKNGTITRFTFAMIGHILNANGDTLFVKAPPVKYVVSNTLSEAPVVRSPYQPADDLFTSIPEYMGWDKAMIIDSSDTIYAKLQWEDYSAAKQFFLTGNYAIKAVDRYGKKVKIPVGITKMLTFDARGRMAQYVNFRTGRDIGLFRLVHDGKCQLFFQHTNGTATANGMMSDTESDAYYVYYNGKLSFLKHEPGGIFDSFKENAKYAFADCPALVQKIKDKAYTAQSDMQVMVKEFNECVKE